MCLDGRVPREEFTVHQVLETSPRMLVNTPVLSGDWLSPVTAMMKGNLSNKLVILGYANHTQSRVLQQEVLAASARSAETPFTNLSLSQPTGSPQLL